MDNLLKIVQWNCRSIINKKSDLLFLLNKYNPITVALQETWLKPEFFFKISGFSTLREDRSDGYGGVALLINNSFNFTPFSLPSHSDEFSIVAAHLNKILIVSIYISCPSSSIFNEINSILSTLPKPFILLGDFNCHHQSWGSANSNHFGKVLLDILDSHNLCFINKGSPTRRTAPNVAVSAVDLSITTPSLASSLSWDILTSTYGSDHFPIVISIPNNSFNKQKRCPRTPRLKHILTHADWGQFSTEMDQRIASLPDVFPGNEVMCAEDFAKSLIDSADNVFPVKSIRSGKLPSPPWWDNECTLAIKSRKKAEIIYAKDMTFENLSNLSNVVASTKKLLKKKKVQGWRNFCTSISPQTSSSEVWQKVKRFRSAFNDNNISSLSPSLADQFLDQLAPASAPQEILLHQFTLSRPIDDSPSVPSIDSPFSLIELKGVLRGLKDSSPGKDGIPYSFLCNLSDSSLKYFLNIINTILLTGNVPSTWKTQIIIPILKPNKSASDASSYRPIALSSVLLKVAEHLVKNRLEWYLESNGLLASSQFGFRRGKSTLDSLSIFTTDIRSALSLNHHTISVFLDISAAYDNVLLTILLEKLNKLKVPACLSNFIINILAERFIIVSEGPLEQNRVVWKGLPQGSVLSPILYNIYTYDLELSLNSPVNVLQYADDLLIYYSDFDLAKATEIVNSTLNRLHIWLCSNGLELSTNKSSVLVFSRMRANPEVTILYNNNQISQVNQAKFLGVIFDSKLSGLPHCEYIAAKCERLLNILRCLSGVWWGSHPFSLKLIYNALIRSKIDYGSFLLEPSNLTGLKKLDLIQSKCLRLITGAMKSSPINALQVECCDPPLKLRRQFLSDKYLYRSVQFSQHPILNKLESLSSSIRSSRYWSHKSPPCLVKSLEKFRSLDAPTHRSHNLPLFTCDYQALILSPNIKYNLNIDKNNLNANSYFICKVAKIWPGWNYIYTDASKRSPSGCTGVGIYHSQYKITQHVKFPPETSVFTGEAFGLLKALEYILIMKLKEAVIFSDSLSALQALEKYPFCRSAPSYPVIIETRNKLYQCFLKGFSVAFAWVPSHCGIRGNEKADRIANEAIEDGDLFPYKNYTHDLINLPRTYLQNSWQDCWSQSCILKGKSYSRIQPSIPIKPWFFKHKFCKRSTSVLIRMRLGHVCTPEHLAKINIIDSPACECGLEVGDLNHIILSCPLYDHVSLYNSIISQSFQLPTSVLCLLSSNNPSIYSSIASFIVSNDIKL